MKKTSNGVRLISIVLALLIILQLPGPALAYMIDGSETASGISFTDSDGNTRLVDESWEERYPYGAFAFEKSGLTINEGESDIIKVYRLGGSAGRATAYISYEPVLIQDEEGNTIYDNAISADDLDIAVEEPIPLARYQPVGKAEAPASGKAFVMAEKDEPDEIDEADETGYIIKLSQEADTYQWQISYDGSWEDITDAISAEFPADAEFVEDGTYDYRCFYTLGDSQFCSISLKGEEYEPLEEEYIPDMPDDIEINAKPEYTKLNLRGQGEDLYAGWAFELIFADGEWVKEIHIDAFSDQLTEAQEAAAFTIRDCEGGEILEAASTLLLTITDMNEPQSSTLGFVLSEISVDKADGKAKVMVERVGGNQRPVSIKYETQDGTAIAGKDYEKTSSTLMFYAGVNKLPATVELIDDGLASDEEVYFDIVLYDLLGDDNCSLTDAQVRVNLINSGMGQEIAVLPNLASQLYDPEIIDVSGSLVEAEGAANSGGNLVSGRLITLEEAESVESDLIFGDSGDMSTQVYNAPNLANIVFNNPGNSWSSTANAAKLAYWQADFHGKIEGADFVEKGETAIKIGKDPNGGENVAITAGIALYSRNEAEAVLTQTGWESMGGRAEVASQLFSSYNFLLDARMGHDTSSSHGGTRYFSYTVPNLSLIHNSGSYVYNPAVVKHFVLSGLGVLDKSWAVRASDDYSNYSNPFTAQYSGDIDIRKGKLNLSMSLFYSGWGDYLMDTLNDASMIWLQAAIFTRRSFPSNSFKLEISTPNDENTAPENAATLSDYSTFAPKVEIVSGQGGVGSNNMLYVGSTVKISAGTAPAGYYVSDLVTYQSKDNGKSWNVFDKFNTPSYNEADKSYTVKLVGKNSGPSLDSSDMSAQYKFRVAYSRTSTLTVDLAPSVARMEGNPAAIDINRRQEALTGYSDGSNYGFSQGSGVASAITYGYNTFDSNSGDFRNTYSENSVTKPLNAAALTNSTEFTFTATNIQWVSFNLPADDLLLINGSAYPGNAKIYLQESDFAGGLNALYYHKDYLTAQSAMKTAINWMAVYLDANGNGLIDGYYKENNSTFELTSENGVKDEFVGYISAEAVNETEFAPVMRNGNYCQYFIKTCYTMTPRSLIMPEGASDSERAQILPAFTTAVNPDSAAYSKLTPESRSYRYIVSGLTRQRSGADLTRTSDGHIKYGREANEKSTLDIPLGGDFSPAQLSAGGKTYTWNPVFRGNILYPFAAPEPIVIENSIAGPTPVTSDYSISSDGEAYTYGATGLERMNGYLSSFTGTTTFAMVTQEQKYETEEILEKMRPGVTLGGGSTGAGDGTLYVQADDAAKYAVIADSVTLSNVSTTPDAEYLKSVQKDEDGSPSSNLDMDSSGSEMGEFNLDLGIDLGAMEIAATDYVTIVLDGNKVGFALGLPIGEVGIGKGAENKKFTDKNKENWTQFSDFFKKGNFGGDDDYKKASQEHNRVKNKSLTPDKSKFKSKSFNVAFAAGAAFMFEYNPLDDGYYFEGMTISISAELSFRIQQRLTVCPIVYFYFEFKGEIELGSGLGVIRDSIEEEAPVLDAISAGTNIKPVNLKYKEEQDENKKLYKFKTDLKAFNIRFNGKLSVEVYTGSDETGWKPADKNSGYIGGFLSSDGTSDTQVVLKKQEGMKLKDVSLNDETVLVVLRPLKHDQKLETQITYIARIENLRNEVYWSGIEISPAIALEIGAGVGVELLKLELYAKLGIEATFRLGVFNMEYLENPKLNKYKPASIESFGFSIGLGLRVVLLAFTFELDAVTYTVDYDGDKWETGWHFLNDWVEGQDASDWGYMGVTIRPPRSSVNKQKLYGPDDNADSNMGTQAYNPTDDSVPFQLSGYGTSVDAANLGKDMLYGSDYKVISAGERNFILYTISREDDAAAEDVPRLVMSELTYKNTASSGEPAKFEYGLANPTGFSGDLYIPLDNDSTGDLDFDAWVDENTSDDGEATIYTINCSWVSYMDESVEEDNPTRPEGAPYSTAILEGPIDGIEMNADNFKTIDKPVETDEQALALYELWYDYYSSLESYNAYSQNRLKNAAKNTVLKKASWTYTSTPFAGEGEGPATISSSIAFTEPEILYGDANGTADTVNYLFAPGGGDAIFFGSTVALDTGNDNYKLYTDFLEAKGMGSNNYDYLRSIKKSYLDVFGIQSNLNIVYDTSEGWKVASTALNTDEAMTNQTLSNVEFTKLKDGVYYVAYTTRQDAYESIDGEITDHVTVERLCLRKLTINESGEAAWGDPYLLRMTKDYDNNNSMDGIYNSLSSEPLTTYESPYFANLGFLTANIDSSMLTGSEEVFSTMSVDEHTFLLFEMNGASYIILDDSLKTIVDSGRGTIHPFFTGQAQTNADGTEGTEASGKLEVTIGTDGHGGIFAIYVGSVPNTTNNALYLSAYDAESNSWGDGVILAMRNMDTYEAAIRYDWGKFTTQAAYLGFKGEGPKKDTGLLDEADIGNLYGHAKDEILKNLKAYSGELGDKNNLTFSKVQATKGADGELLVVSQGSLTSLGLTSYKNMGKTEYVVMPNYKNGGMESQLGMYAISYSKGRANLGQGKISFNKPDFSAGSKLHVNISAVNTGDTAFRGSSNQPVRAILSAKGQDLAEWEIKENIRSGRTIALEGFCNSLTGSLEKDDSFTLSLSEYVSKAGEEGYNNPQQVSIDLFKVEEYPDLAIEDLEVSLAGISADGSKTILNIDFVAANQGSAEAKGVYAQFTYADGKDENDNTTYSVIDLRDSSLEIDQAQELEIMTASQNNDVSLEQGILYIYNAADGNNDLEKGKGRRVHGTIEVLSKAFKSGEAGYLDLKIELFTGSDTITGMAAGVLNADHNEYYSANNSQNKAIQASTSYTVAPSIVIPLGTTTLIPVTAVSSRGTKPALSVTEIDDINDGLNLGILNFKQTGTQTGGYVSGVLSITPSAPGSGIIHIYDADTESQTAVAFIVTDSKDGIDIFIDNEAFTFINSDDTLYDPDKTGQAWLFKDVPAWGEGDNKETPLRSNLSMGDKGASFTFSSVAEKIYLYFQGKVTVSSDFPGYMPKDFTNEAGGKTPTEILFGENKNYAAYTVTVRIDSSSASFDRMVEEYSGGVVPVPDYDGQNPMFIWSRSFPATASIKPGEKAIPLSLYVLDNNGLLYISINGKQYDGGDNSVTAINDQLLWKYDFGNIASNGNYDIIAKDISGNTVSTVLMVDWFHESPSGDDKTVNVPLYDADFYIGTDKWKDTAIGSDDIGGLNISFKEGPENKKKENNTHEVYFFDGSEFAELSPDSPEKPGVFGLAANGIYWTRTVNDDSTWGAKVLYMGRIDGNIPQVKMTFDPDNNRLLWQAYKETSSLFGQVADIETVTINGFKVNGGTGKNLNGRLSVEYNGSYELAAKDLAGNNSKISLTVETLEIDLDSCSFTPAESWNQDRNNGSITADLTNAVGAEFNKSDSDEANNKYIARYQMTLVSGDYDTSTPEWDESLSWINMNKDDGLAHSYEGLSPGDYKLIVRDAANPSNYASLMLAVEDKAITTVIDNIGVSRHNKKDGKIIASAESGNTQGFEFALMPIDKQASEKQYTLADFLALDRAESTEDDIIWSLADNVYLNPREKTFDGLDGGWYLVALRGLYGVTAEDFAELAAVRNILAEAQLTLESAAEPTEDQINALEDARAAYDSKAQAIRQLSASAYDNDEKYWDGAHITLVKLNEPGVSSGVNLSRVTTDSEGALVFTILSPNKSLTKADMEKIISANKKDDIIIRSDGLSLRIPKGTLVDGFDINRLIVDFQAAADGKLVQYTDLDGNVSILPWCLVSGKTVSYLIIGLGDYKLINNPVKFDDIEGEWGAEYIIFTAARNLFSGTGDDIFSPHMQMTRAMFVTVLWRLAGSPQAEGDQPFNDLSADWYEEAVLWAVQNKIVSGYSNELFGPDEMVSREQMCVFLCRFMGYLGMDLDRDDKDLKFVDEGSISSWAKENVYMCADTGLIQGVGENTFDPLRGAGRMEVSTILSRFITEIVKKYSGK